MGGRVCGNWTCRVFSPERLEALALMFDLPTEVVAGFRAVHQQAEFVAGREDILQMLQRRPCSIDDTANGLDMHRNEVIKYVEELNAEHLLEQSLVADKLYYKAAKEVPL
jgi:predicted transcriptional regulator